MLRVPSFATTRRYFVPLGDVNITPDACDVPTLTSPVKVDIPVTFTLPLTVSAASAIQLIDLTHLRLRLPTDYYHHHYSISLIDQYHFPTTNLQR